MLIKKIINKIQYIQYVLLRSIAKLVNLFKPKILIDENLLSLFKNQKKSTIDKEVFQWTLHDNDGRGNDFQRYDINAWQRWLSWYRYHHFKWNTPEDPVIQEYRNKILSLGRNTWRNLFERYYINELDRHDLYSLPDIYYICKIIGNIPKSVIDIGGGWGRLGMAWSAVGVRVVGITDSIEQSYMLQYQYLSSIPKIKFTDFLVSNNLANLNFNQQTGIVHFPFWHIVSIPSKSVEAVSTIQVLREVNDKFILFLFEQVKRVLVPRGIFYIRDNDHEYKEKCMHSIKITDTLLKMGFELVLKSELIHGEDIHGVPRIFQWKG